jgi:hypothetical protein
MFKQISTHIWEYLGADERCFCWSDNEPFSYGDYSWYGIASAALAEWCREDGIALPRSTGG